MGSDKKIERITQILLAYKLDGKYTEKQALVEIGKVIATTDATLADTSIKNLLAVPIPNKLSNSQEYLEIRDHLKKLKELTRSDNYFIYSDALRKVEKIQDLMTKWQHENWEEKRK